MLICDDWVIREKRITIHGLMSNLHSVDDPSFPLLHEELCVFLLLTDGYGSGMAKIACVFDETGQAVFETNPRTVEFRVSPTEVVGLPFRIRDCVFPQSGMYSFQFWYDGEMIEVRPVRLR